jgi:hypothetical protein
MSAKRATPPKTKGKNCAALGHRNPNATKKNTWSIDEDDNLRGWVEKEGRLWAEFSGRLTKKSAKQVRERYTQHLDPTLKKTPITPKEGNEIIRLAEMHGKEHQWANIARSLEGRSDNDVKNYYYTYIKKRDRENARVAKEKGEMFNTAAGTQTTARAQTAAATQSAAVAQVAAAAQALCFLRRGKMDVAFITG